MVGGIIAAATRKTVSKHPSLPDPGIAERPKLFHGETKSASKRSRFDKISPVIEKTATHAQLPQWLRFHRSHTRPIERNSSLTLYESNQPPRPAPDPSQHPPHRTTHPADATARRARHPRQTLRGLAGGMRGLLLSFRSRIGGRLGSLRCGGRTSHAAPTDHQLRRAAEECARRWSGRHGVCDFGADDGERGVGRWSIVGRGRLEGSFGEVGRGKARVSSVDPGIFAKRFHWSAEVLGLDPLEILRLDLMSSILNRVNLQDGKDVEWR